MSKTMIVSALLVATLMTMVTVPSLGMSHVNEAVKYGDAHHHHLGGGLKKQLWNKVHAAVKQHQYKSGSILAPDAIAVGDTIVADATAHIGSTLFNKIGALVSAAVNQYGSSVVIPGESEKHFSFSAIHFSTFDVGSIAFDFVSPNKIRFSINDLNIVIPETEFHVFTKILFAKVSCHGYFKGTVTGTSVVVDVTLDTDPTTQKLVVTGATSTVNFGRLDISHKMEDFLCKVGQSIIELFLGNIDKLINKFIKEKLPADVGPIVEKLLNNVFTKLPLTVVGNPVINTDGISVLVDVERYPKASSLLSTSVRGVPTNNNNNFHVAKPAKGSLMQMLNAPVLPTTSLIAVGDNNRDINLIITEANLNKILHIVQLEGKINVAILSKNTTTEIFKLLIPAAYARCPDCRLFFTISAPVTPPTVDLHNNNTLAISVNDLFISVAAVNSSSAVDPPSPSTVVPLFTLALNGTVSLLDLHTGGDSDDTILFKLGVPVFDLSLQGSSVGPIPLISTVSYLLRNLIVDVIVPAFNSKFPGIPFPNTIVQNVLALVSEDQVNVGLNLNF